MRLRALMLAFLVLAATPATLPSRAAGPYPEAIEWSPTGANVALDAPIVITWSARMDAASVEAAFAFTDGTSLWSAADFQWIHSTVPPWTSQASPLAPLPASTDFLAIVAPTARDATGAYPLDQDGDGVGGEPTDALSWTFRTENGTPPRVIWHTPADSERDVSVAASVTITFDEPMDRASVEAAFSFSPGGSGTFLWTPDGTGMTFDPRLKLLYNRTYTVSLKETATDANGAPLDGNGDGVGGDGYAFGFRTEVNTAPPAVVEVTPSRGATGASVTAVIDIQFTKPMDPGSVEASFSYTDGMTVWDGTAGEFSWTGREFPYDAVTFNPFANFPFAATITVTLNASQARDPDGYALDGNSNGTSDGSPEDDYTWSFTTEATDTTPPRVLAVDPGDGATGVLETMSIALTFSEAMDRPGVEDAFTLQDSVRTWTKADGWFAWSLGNERVAYTPSMTLPFDRTYTLTLAGDATDVNGNPMGAAFASTFRTRPEPDTVPPAVVSTFPLDRATDVARDVRISLTFNDAMNRERTEAAIALARFSGYDLVSIPITDFAWDAGDHTVSFRTLASLEWDALHRVTVSQGAKDDADLSMSTAFTFIFTTVVWSGRVVGRVVDAEGPVSGATVRLGNWTTQAAANGTFAFPTVRAGTYELTVAKPGYTTLRRTVTLSHRDAGPDFAQIDLGEFRLQRAEGMSVAALAAGLVAVIAGAIVLGLLLRRLRPPPVEAFEDLEEEYGEAER